MPLVAALVGSACGSGEDLYAPISFRSSDHDPVIIGLRFTNTPPVITQSDPVTLTAPCEPVGTLRLDATDASGRQAQGPPPALLLRSYL